MNNQHGIFIFIDDNLDELVFFEAALESLGFKNKVVYLRNGEEAFKYLKKANEEIFLILSDINMPKINGLELKRLIDSTPELRLKAIPFVFQSNSANPTEIKEAYALNIQGYFTKPSDVEDYEKNLKKIVEYWSACVHPNQLR